MPRKRKIATSNENAAPQNPGKVVEHPNRLSPDEINVMKIIINSQKTDTNHKKGFAELEKLYGKVCIGLSSKICFQHCNHVILDGS